MSNWSPVTEIPYRPESTVPADPRDRALAFVLTPQERDMALVYTLRLEMQRREQNKRDEQRRRDALAAEAAKALEAESFL